MSTPPDRPGGPAEARAIAFRLLGRREHSERELARKLEQRGVDSGVAGETIEQLAADGLVSDARFAELFVRNRVAGLHGPLKIRAQLRQKGVADRVIDGALSEYDAEWPRSALAWARKKSRDTLDRAEKARIYRSGMNRGFSHEHMMRAIDHLEKNSRSGRGLSGA